MKGMTTCKVCGRDFALMIEEHYVAQDPQKVGAIVNLVNTDKAFKYDAFDCPHCGCQNIMQPRKPEACPCDYGICDECDHVDEGTPLDHDGCKGCKYDTLDCKTEPCASCKYNHPDYYVKKEEDDE